MKLFDRVKQLADRQRLSINDLEEKVGFSRNTMYKWKNQMPNANKVQDVADYFNVSTDYLLGRTNNPKVNNGNRDEDQDILVAAHIDDRLTEEELEDVRQYIEFLKSRHEK